MTDDDNDPFAHLHDEHYRDRFNRPLVGHRDMVFMGGRDRIALAGPWRFALDLFDEGLRQRWFADTPGPPETWPVPRDYDASGGETIEVPSCFTAVRPEWRYFEGGAWYTRDIDGSTFDPDARVVLRVGAANYAARVFLNGRFLAAHMGGSTPFFVELTGHLESGQNRLQINVDNRRDPRRVPMHHIDWFNHGGLFREVDLIALPPVFIRDVSVALAPGGDGSRIAVAVRLSDRADGNADVFVPELRVAATVPIEAGQGGAIIDAAPDLWSPDTPRLYDVGIRFGDDRVSDRVGFRDIRVDGERILFNGDDVYLRGICVHEDDAEHGRVTSEADLRRRFAHMRELGCNFARLAHYPHHERAAEIADEVGIMLWAEIPVYWAIRFKDRTTYADAENQLLELIARDRNRASVIMWGVGNENADTDARFKFMSGLADTARQADPSRLVTAACLINRETFRIEDRLADALDIIGLNEYFGWYEPDVGPLRTLLANSNPGKPVVISETGADALAGFHGSLTTFFTEERQAQFYRDQFAVLSLCDYVRGVCPWLLYDFRSERRQMALQGGFNRKGLIAEDKATKKQAFDVVAAHYRAMLGN
ncbi:glycoside hydrolase family 2 protein [Bauldia sp.]|uniref:glycoside hydrolase family 2 protein n=1 Tax=Bauldia sp. TaxID=2575872 RepID=UPI003BAA8854